MSCDSKKIDFRNEKLKWMSVAFDYIPHQLLQNVDESKLINSSEDLMKSLQILLDNSNNKLRIYGTAQELAENLKIYQNFPLNHKVFGYDATTPFEVVANASPSLKKENFFRKQDFLKCLHSIVRSKYEAKHGEFPRKLVDHMNDQLNRLDGIYEFYCYDENTVDQIHDNLGESLKSISRKKILLSESSKSASELSSAVQEQYLNALNKIITDNPKIFLPYSEMENKNMPVFVRIFQNRADRFVMKSEFFNAINILNPDKEPLKCDDKDGFLYTMDFVDVVNSFRSQLNRIDFILTRITKTDHAAVPIMTPTGDHCILVRHALEETLNRMISALNIFQKIKCDAWNNVVKYVEMLESMLPSDIGRNDFIKLDVFNKMKEKTDEYWKDWDNIPIKSVRNVGKNGFTVKDMKDELKYLGIADVFPGSPDLEEALFTSTVNKKKKKVLRTCDMFFALEKFQFAYFIVEFPYLCKLVGEDEKQSNYDCKTCATCIAGAQVVANQFNQFMETKWKEYADSEVNLSVCDGENRPEIKCKLEIPGEILTSNYIFFTDEQLKENDIKYFLMDCTDFQNVIDTTNKTFSSLIEVDENNFLTSPKKFSECHTKRIYIRSIPSTSSINRVFTDEVLEMLPILLKQQNSLIDSSDYLFEKYRQKWKCDGQYMYNTIDMDELKKVLEEFDIDKSLITIVPDPVYKLTKEEMSHKSGDLFVSVFSPNGKKVMDTSQAIFHIFQSVVVGVNWDRENRNNCEVHMICLDGFKRTILAVMKRYHSMKQGVYVSCDCVEHYIKTLKERCACGHKMKYNTDSSRGFSFAGTEDREYISQMQYMAGYTDMFFQENHMELYNLIRSMITFKIPIDVQQRQKEIIEGIMNSKIDGISTKSMDSEDKRTDTRITVTSSDELHGKLELEQLSKKENGTNIDWKSDEKDECNESELAESQESIESLGESQEKNPKSVSKVSEETEDSNQNVMSKKIEKAPNESKCCSKCLRTSERCNEAMNELKMTQNKLSKFEKKAKNFDELEKKMKEMAKEMKQLKKDNTQLSTENEELKLKISKTEATDEKFKLKWKTSENKLKIIEKEFDEYKKNEEIHRNETEKMFKKMETEMNESFEKELIRLKEEFEDYKMKHSTKMSSLEEEISTKDTVINELRQSNSRFSNEREEHEKTIQTLFEQLSSVPSTSSKQSEMSSTREEAQIPGGYRFQLVTLQKIKDTIRRGNSLKHAKEMVEKLTSLTNRSEVQSLANYELTLFEGKIRNYLQAVEMNIQKLKKSGDVTDLPSLPEYPSLSERFMKEYWNEIEKQPSTSSESTSELSDSECLICLVNMESSDETIKCDNCRRRFHSECASEWFKVKRVCPACNGGLLDPTEYPSLG